MPEEETWGCARCGSPRVYPKIWVQGFFPGVNANRQVYVCRDCGAEGMLLTFASEAERAKYAQEGRTQAPEARPARTPPDAIPILPIDAVPILEVKGLDAIPIYRSKVVDVRWTERGLQRGDYRVDVTTYWEAVGGPRYNAGRIYVLDLAGINHGRPNFDELRMIAKRATVLFDMGARRPEDVMDGFMVDVESVVVGTKTLRSLRDFQDIRDISEGVVPCLDVADGVVWSELSHEDRGLRAVAAALGRMGFPSLAVMDLRRLGTASGPDPDLLAVLEGMDVELFLGGGIREEDAPGLREKGIAHALVDPYTPVIRALLPSKEAPAPADALPAPQPRPDIRGTPAPG